MKPNYFRGFLKGIVLIQLFVIIIIAGVGINLNDKYLQKVSSLNVKDMFMPLLAVGITNDQASSLIRGTNYVLAGNNTFFQTNYLTDKMPEDIMAANIQALAYGESDLENVNSQSGEAEPKIIVKDESPEPAKSTSENSALFKGNKVVFYCTHSAETYIPNSGKARLDGKRGLINQVAAAMSGEIEKKGVQAQFINTIHDSPDYNSSYTRSRKTVSNLVDADNNILAIFDVHRDSIPGTETAPTVRINGKKSARILIIVGTDQRKSHPNWKKNFSFAQELYARSEKLYPGLIKGVVTKAGTYNQEFHTHALLLEMGSDKNTLSEASYAGQLFAKVLVEVLKEEI
jgi:stage II sporulation protein P